MRAGRIFAGVAVAVLVMGAAFHPTNAAAQWGRLIRAALIQNADEKGRNPYMQFQAVACPGGSTLVCAIPFPSVPAGKRLVIEHVNASILYGPGGIRRVALLAPGDAIFAFPTYTSRASDVIVVNASTVAYFDDGHAPVIQVVTLNVADAPLVTATLSGYFVDLGNQSTGSPDSSQLN